MTNISPGNTDSGGRRSTSDFQSHRQPLLFDEKYPLTGKNTPPILRAVKSNILSIFINKSNILSINCVNLNKI
jgi:hypothetical protein